MNTTNEAGVKPATINPGSFELVITSSGLEPERQIEIRNAFLPFASRANEWAVKVATVTDSRIARETRLAMRRERIDLEKKHAEFKARTLAWTRAVDGSRKAISDAYDAMETQMGDIEKAEERRIAAEKAAKKAERDAALRQYGMDASYMNTGEMTDAQFLGQLDIARTAYEAKLAAAKKAEEERIAREKAEAEARAEKARKDAEERERQRVENERLRKEAAEREAAAKVERERLAAERAATEAKARIEREAAEAKLAEERKARADAEAKALAERRKAEAEAAAKLKAERDAREKLEKEAAAAKKAEADRIAAEKAAAARAAAAPDAEKLRAYANVLSNTGCGELATEAGRAALDEISIRVQNLAQFIHQTAAEMEATT